MVSTEWCHVVFKAGFSLVFQQGSILICSVKYCIIESSSEKSPCENETFLRYLRGSFEIHVRYFYLFIFKFAISNCAVSGFVETWLVIGLDNWKIVYFSVIIRESCILLCVFRSWLVMKMLCWSRKSCWEPGTIYWSAVCCSLILLLNLLSCITMLRYTHTPHIYTHHTHW